jgi:AbiV family abortive infection protein
MKNLKKISKMSKLAFKNALRLHYDSIFLYKNKSFPSACLLSILAQEEIGKSYILEDHVYQMRGREKEIDSEYEKLIVKALKDHKLKQGWFSRQADDVFKYGGKKYPRGVREMSSGKLEERKQNSAYLGLSRKDGKMDPKGKISEPSRKIRPEDAKYQITKINNFVVELIEGCRRGIYTVDTDELDDFLTISLAKRLEKLWPSKTRDSINKLKKLRKFPLE